MITSETSPQGLACLLGTSYSRLTHTLYAIGTNQLYTNFEINKKSGKKREIKAPHPQLKHLQTRLNTHLEKLYDEHPAATAFIKGRGIVYNANKHTKKAAVFNIDLKDFYGQIHFGRVRGMLMAKPYSLKPDTARIIAHICCVDRTIPQGAPTSPLISNMICNRLDKQLSHLAKRNRAFYTRYAEDITFSFRELSENEIYCSIDKDILPNGILIDIISKNGFSINGSKTRLQTYSERQVVTGLKVNRKVNVERRYIRTTRAMVYSLVQGVEEANLKFVSKLDERYSSRKKKETPKLEDVVSGRINFIGMVKGKESSVYQSLARKYNSLDIRYKLPLKPLSINRELESRLYFRSFEDRLQLEQCVWCVSFEGVRNLELEQQLVQGTAFVLKGNRVITASHTFNKAGDPKYCYLYRIKTPSETYKAILIKNCPVSDIAELKFDCEEVPTSSYLKVAPLKELHAGYQLSAVGFPQLHPGHNSVSIVPCNVINSFTKSTFKYVEVDGAFQGGISGGPVVNAYMQVVGMALLGLNVTKTDDEEIHLEGNNAFVSAEYFS